MSLEVLKLGVKMDPNREKNNMVFSAVDLNFGNV